MPVFAELPRRPLLGVAGAVAVALLTVTGCSAGQDAQTVEQTSVVDGTGFQAGAVTLRDVGLRAPTGPSYAEGATAYLEGLMVNQNSDTDQLVSISSPVASSIVLYADGGTAVLGEAPTPSAPASGSGSGSSTPSVSTPSDSSSSAGSASPSDTASPSGSASASGSPTASGSGAASGSSSPSAAAAPTPLTSIMLPTNQSIQFGYSNQQLAIVFRGLTRQLFPAQSFPITFTFAKAGSVTATISVKLPVGRTLDAPTVNTEPSEGGGE